MPSKAKNKIATQKKAALDQLPLCRLEKTAPMDQQDNLRQLKINEMQLLNAENALITERHSAIYLNSHDQITQLCNRGQFEKELSRVLDDYRQYNCDHALVYIDLDQFKVINDVCGHEAGDQLLRQISTIIRRHLDPWDTGARLGGDEFGLILPYNNKDSALKRITKLLECIRATRFHWHDARFSLSASVGLVMLDECVVSSTEAISKVDAACYMAKEEGRNRIYQYCRSDKMLQTRFGEIATISHINKALDENRLEIYAQTIMPLQSHTEQWHYEILVRMRDNQGKLVPPNLFLPAAERFNMIAQIDRWVFKSTCELLADHRKQLAQIGKVSINLSGHSLSDDRFADFILRILAETQIPAEKLCFEITETGVIANLEKGLAFIDKMHKQGIRFSLDDFGSGLSSFAYLKTMPVDYLKIDGIFVENILNDPVDKAMVKSIHEVSMVMGKKTIAEFVQNDAMIACLREMGIHYAQGYGIAEPKLLKDLL